MDIGPQFFSMFAHKDKSSLAIRVSAVFTCAFLLVFSLFVDKGANAVSITAPTQLMSQDGMELKAKITCFFKPFLSSKIRSQCSEAKTAIKMKADTDGMSVSSQILSAAIPVAVRSSTVSAVSSTTPLARSVLAAVAPAKLAPVQKPKSAPFTSSANAGITRSELDAALRGIRTEILRAIPAGTASYAASAPASYYGGGGGYSVPPPNTASTDYVAQQTATVPVPWTQSGSALYYSGGNVGIGTSTPSVPLYIVNSATATVTQAIFRNENGTALGNSSQLRLSVLNSTVTNAQDVGIAAVTDSVTAGQRGTALAFYFGNQATGFTEGMRLTGATVSGNSAHAGRLGLGTSTPSSRLHVTDTSGNLNNVIFHTLTANSGSSVLELRSDNMSGRYLIKAHGNYSAEKNDAFAVMASGYVGINNINPSAILDVVSDGLATKIFTVSTATTSLGDLVTVTSAGNVGIGSSTPSAKFTIKGAGSTTGINFQTTNSSNVPLFTILDSGNVGIGTTTPGSVLSVKATAGANPFTISSSSNSVMLTMLQNGNVGIGTTSPSRRLSVASDGTYSGYFAGRVGVGIQAPGHLLHVNGNAAVENTMYLGATSLSGVLDAQTYCSGSGEVGGGCATNNGIVLHNAANGSDVMTGILFKPGQGDPSVAQIKAMYDSVGGSTARLSFLVRDSGGNLTDRLRITDAGRIGIGTTTPSAQLTNTGTVRFAALGSAGASLITDSLGNVTVSSDERLKDVQGGFASGLDQVLMIDPITYRWKSGTGYDTEATYAGFSAQDVQGAIPEAVSTDSRGFLTLADRPILAALVNAVKELAGKAKDAASWIAHSADYFKSKKVETDTLCIGNTCVTEQQLQDLLQKNSVAPVFATPAPVIPVPAAQTQDDSQSQSNSQTQSDQGSGAASGSAENPSVDLAPAPSSGTESEAGTNPTDNAVTPPIPAPAPDPVPAVQPASEPAPAAPVVQASE